MSSTTNSLRQFAYSALNFTDGAKVRWRMGNFKMTPKTKRPPAEKKRLTIKLQGGTCILTRWIYPTTFVNKARNFSINVNKDIRTKVEREREREITNAWQAARWWRVFRRDDWTRRKCSCRCPSLDSRPWYAAGTWSQPALTARNTALIWFHTNYDRFSSMHTAT